MSRKDSAEVGGRSCVLSIHRRGHVVPPMGALHGLYRVHGNALAVVLVCGCNLIRLDVSLTLIALRLCRLPGVQKDSLAWALNVS
jgi:hypothetical protein